MTLFFGVFAAIGALAFWGIGIRPVMRALDARSWTETPCTILTSQVERHSGSKGGSTYNVAITFEYQVGRQTLRGSRYDFNSGSSSGLEGKQAVVDRFPPGARTTCWVDPNDRTRAVIDRNLGWWILWGLFPLMFLGAGLGGLVFVLASARAKSAAGPQAPPSVGTGSIAPS